MTLEELKERMEKLASRECWQNDPEFMPHEYAGGNIDDAYNGGVDDGETLLARHLLKEFFHNGPA